MTDTTSVWLEVVGGTDPDATATLTAVEALASAVIETAVVGFGGRAVADEHGSTHLVFQDLQTSLAALDQILTTTEGNGLRVRAAVGTDLEDARDARALLRFGAAGDVIVTGEDGGLAGSAWRSSAVGRTRLPGSDRTASVVRLDKPEPTADKAPITWTRGLVLLPLGGLGFAAASTTLLRDEHESDEVIIEPEPVAEVPEDPDPAPVVETLPPPDLSPEPDEYVEPRIVTHSPEQMEIVEDALERFDALGLEMPSGLTIYFHEPAAYENCGGHAGLASHGDEERIDMCTEAPFAMHHELAHMWAHENLTDQQRNEFVELHGLGGWRGPEEPREDGLAHPHTAQGTEHAADVIAWGLLEGKVRPKAISDNDDEGLALAFENLLGVAPPHLQDPDPLGIGGLAAGLSTVPAEPGVAPVAAATDATAEAVLPETAFEPDTTPGFDTEAVFAVTEEPLWDDDDIEDDLGEVTDDTPDEEQPIEAF